jgi:hypothetical protein
MSAMNVTGEVVKAYIPVPLPPKPQGRLADAEQIAPLGIACLARESSARPNPEPVLRAASLPTLAANGAARMGHPRWDDVRGVGR